RALVKSARACPGPIARSTYGAIVAGIRPSRASAKAKRAPSAATATSAHATSPAPPPIAGPWTRAITAFVQASTCSNASRRATASCRFSSRVRSRLARIHAMSAPPPDPRAPRPRRDRAPGAGEHHHADAVVGLCLADPPGELLHQGGPERVPPLRAIEGEREHGPLAVGRPAAHIRNTPKVVVAAGAREAASSPNARTSRVSSGSITPSSQR